MAKQREGNSEARTTALKETGAQSDGTKAREEYLRDLENDPMFEEITGDGRWAIVVGAAEPPNPEPPESPKTHQEGFIENLFNAILGIAALVFVILVIAYLIFANVGSDMRGWVFFGILIILAAILTTRDQVSQ